ncbi:UvrD-helicase domain-containing protein [Desulfovibrio desulfuricans]|uniref:UvrD-helicase domain-containing protein n=1 Tax=Desulfovibrio desulfuricans TaxID=876 RepID=UPI0003B3997F|nr:UvrD-helicase domain-containing protein [Desulfovibrio desulfuricans]
MLTLSLDAKAIPFISNGEIDIAHFFKTKMVPSSSERFFCCEVDNHGYILSRNLQSQEGILTISLEQNGPFEGVAEGSREEAFGRILKASQKIFENKRNKIPPSWQPFRSDNLLSFQADKYIRKTEGGKINAGRIVLEQSRQPHPQVFAYAFLPESSIDLPHPNNHNLLSEALQNLPKAIEKNAEIESSRLQNEDFNLNENFTCEFADCSIEEWKKKLTVQQLQFVLADIKSSLRLQGPAGSGKTLALVLKCAIALQEKSKNGENFRILFLTHALRTKNDVEALFLSLDDGMQEYIKNENIVIETIYSYAQGTSNYDFEKIIPVSLDGHDGMQLQSILLEEVLADFITNSWDAYRASCSETFRTLIGSPAGSTEWKSFVWELLNEFSCVIDSYGVHKTSDIEQRYLKERRYKWMMPLENESDKIVVVRLYQKYVEKLRHESVLGCDQLVADFLRYLDSFTWEALRPDEGFDLVVVDELHLFNRQERLAFVRLLKPYCDKTPLVIMAYDLRQSPRDTFLGLSDKNQSSYWKISGLGDIKKIEFTDNFRYSPQIAMFMKSLERQFPGADLYADWGPEIGKVHNVDGPTPIIKTHKNSNLLFATVTDKASKEKKKNTKLAIAILSVSREKFIQNASKIKDNKSFLVLNSRDGTTSIPVDKKKCVYSMPEFVAGMQFDYVYVVDVNQNETACSACTTSLSRKFASQIYLGASRAKSKLELHAADDCGGAAPQLSVALFEKSLLPE